MNSAAYDMFYQNALLGLMNGCLMPWDKEVLSDTPLPSAVIEPYMSKEIPDVRESMRLTYETMVVWIDEARKVNYFSKRFVQLSKLIMTGVTTMGRGLITLHARGEEPGDVPMSIEDLIGVASYHFRKSHLGVLQTVRSHPEISERLLVNQIGWNNMLMRLFKTRDKLNQKPEIGNQKAEAAGIEDAGCKKSAFLPSGEKDPMLPEAKDETFDPFGIFGPADRGLSAPAAISEPGAFTAPRAFSSYDSKQVSDDIGRCHQDRLSENEEGRMKQEEKTGKQMKTRNRKAEIGNQNPEDGEDQTENGLPTEAPDPDIPPYLQILQNVYARGGSDEDGKLTFTFDEICYLAADPDFNRFYPEQAAQMRGLLQNPDSS